MTNQEIILTEEEIKELIGNLNRNPDETEIRAVKDWFWLRPYALQHLEDKEFRKSLVRLIYLHKNALDWYIKVDKEVKSLQSLTASLEQEKNELLEENKQLEAKLEERDNEIEELEERVEIEQEEAQKFHIKSEEWKKWQTAEIVANHDAREKELLEEIRVLKSNIHWLENKEQTIEKYKDKELPALPKQQKKSRLLKIKQLVSKVKEKTQEKFQTLIIQKSK